MTNGPVPRDRRPAPEPPSALDTPSAPETSPTVNGSAPTADAPADTRAADTRAPTETPETAPEGSAPETPDTPDTPKPPEAPEQRPELAPWHDILRKQVPFGIVLLIAAIGILRVVEYHWRQGAVLVGAALLVAAVFRVAIPDDRAGLLGVRSRFIDVLAYVALGGCMMFVAFTIQGGPLA